MVVASDDLRGCQEYDSFGGNLYVGIGTTANEPSLEYKALVGLSRPRDI